MTPIKDKLLEIIHLIRINKPLIYFLDKTLTFIIMSDNFD